MFELKTIYFPYVSLLNLSLRIHRLSVKKVGRTCLVFTFLKQLRTFSFVCLFLTCVPAILDNEDHGTSKCDCRADSKTQ